MRFITKHEAYGIDEKELPLVLNYLTNLNQRTKINISFNDWKYLEFCLSKLQNILENLELDMKILLKWFSKESQ